jgi:2-polyprenyl-6-methoxyphenol hydroxylase-like FAD-dependent oxidoreductase
MRTDPLHVIIIGAGYGGLALAHALRQAGVSCAVYEAQRSCTAGIDGYQVGVELIGNRALKRCLPPELFANFLATSARAPRYLTVLTQKKKVTAAIPLHGNADEISSEQPVSRQTLRQLLLSGLEDRVHFGKEFTRYEQQANGTVTALFTDGSSASGQVLVAADGTHSAVRAQYLPHAMRHSDEIVAIGAKVPLTRAALDLLPAASQDGLSLVVAPKGLTCVWHVMKFGRDQCGGSRDYLAWGLWAPQHQFPADVLQLRGRELVNLVLQLTPKWHRDFHALFSMSDPVTSFPLNIPTSEPVSAWRPSNITLIGDAIHPLTGGRRVGANTALRDAMLLSHALAAVQAGSVRLLNAVAAYETEIIHRGHSPLVGPAMQAAGRS